MKQAYVKPSFTFIPFNHEERIASSTPTPCYPIYSNTDQTGDNICDTAPVYVGKTN